MKNLIAVIIATAAHLLTTGVSSAAYVFEEGDPEGVEGTRATNVDIRSVCLAPGVLHVIKTTDLSSASADPVMHLMEWSATTSNGAPYWHEVGYSDDEGIGNNAMIWYRSDAAGGICQGQTGKIPYRIIVRSYDNPSGGHGVYTFRLNINGDLLSPHNLGGYQLNTGTNVSSDETLETVRVNNGAVFSRLHRLAWLPAEGRYKYQEFSSTGGVGNGTAKLEGTLGTSHLWLVSTQSHAAAQGPIRVIRNHVNAGNLVSVDTDLDGLCNSLEVALGTCPGDCEGVIDPRDTDGDGIKDLYEVLGKRWQPGTDAVIDQELYRWGARPLRMDMFVEIDHRDRRETHAGAGGAESALAVRPREDAMTMVAKRFRELTKIQNLDGTTGVYVHFDIGQPCSRQLAIVGDFLGAPEPGWVVDDVSEICGDFGGAGVVQAVDNEGDMACLAARKEFVRENCNPIRDGIFHYTVAESTGTGQGAVGGNILCFNSNNINDQRQRLTHELGHNLGMQHWGSDDSGRINNKINYPSLMNYLYEASYLGRRSDTSFSRGELDDINPKNLSEDSSFSGGAQAQHIAAAPWSFLEQVPETELFDWNRDGEWSSSVRGQVGHAPQVRTGGLDLPMEQGMANIKAPLSWQGILQGIGRGIRTRVGVGGAFFRDPDNKDAIWVFSNENTSGGDGTLRRDIRNLDASINYWNPEFDLKEGLHSATEPEAVAWLDSVYVFVAPPKLESIKWNSYSANGSASSWQDIPNPTGINFTSVSAAVFEGSLYLSARDADKRGSGSVWTGSLNEKQQWSGWTPAATRINSGTEDGVVESEFTPTLVVASDGQMYMFTVGPERPADDDLTKGVLETYVNPEPLGSGQWTRLSNVVDGAFAIKDHGNCTVVSRPGVSFREHQNSAGAALGDGNGAFWFWYTIECLAEDTPLATVQRTTRAGFDTFGPSKSFSMGQWSYTPIKGAQKGDACYSEIPGAKITLVSTPDSLAALLSGSCLDSVVQVPHADGHADVVISDFDDHAQIELGLCSSLGGRDVVCRGPLAESQQYVFCD